MRYFANFTIATIDHATDERIQRTIRDEMQEATILCIARKFSVRDVKEILTPIFSNRPTSNDHRLRSNSCPRTWRSFRI